MDGEQVAVQDAGVDHRQAPFEQKVGPGREEMGIEGVALDVSTARMGEPAATRPAGQAELFHQADAAGRSGFEDDGWPLRARVLR